MNSKKARLFRAKARLTAHSANEITTKGAFKSRIGSFLHIRPGTTNIVRQGDDVIFVQRLLDTMSVKSIAKKLKKIYRLIPGPQREAF